MWEEEKEKKKEQEKDKEEETSVCVNRQQTTPRALTTNEAHVKCSPSF